MTAELLLELVFHKVLASEKIQPHAAAVVITFGGGEYFQTRTKRKFLENLLLQAK